MSYETLHVAMSSSTDWPSIIVTGAIGVGSIMTSFTVAWITYNNQKTQNKAKIAELRQKWLEDFRKEISNFCSLSTVLGANYKMIDKFQETPECSNLYKEFFISRSNIILMLDPVKEYTPILKSLMDDIQTELRSNDIIKMRDVSALIKALQEQSNALLEKAWCDIKNDLLD